MENLIEVVGTMFFRNGKLLIDKPRSKPTFQMIGGKVEKGETTREAAIRECHEELGENAIFDENCFEQILEFDEIASSDNITKIHYYLFKYSPGEKVKLGIIRNNNSIYFDVVLGKKE